MSLEYIRESKRQLYISKDVWRGLWLLSKANEKTADEIADDMLRDALHKQYPYLIEFQAEQSKMEKEMIKKLNPAKRGGNPQE